MGLVVREGVDKPTEVLGVSAVGGDAAWRSSAARGEPQHGNNGLEHGHAHYSRELCSFQERGSWSRGHLTLEHQLCMYLNGPQGSRACGTHRVTKLHGGAAVHYKKELETWVEAE